MTELASISNGVQRSENKRKNSFLNYRASRVAAFKSLCTSANAQIERKGDLEPSSALKEINDQDDHGNYEQEMDQAAANVADETKKPENDEDHNYSPEHGYSFRLS
jgi:hypothetical protein